MSPYRSYNQYLKELFGCRVYKVSIDAGFSCPNRDGRKGYNGCTFCDAHGASSLTNKNTKNIQEQVLDNIESRRERYGAKKFIAYFQSYTNTYAPIEELKKMYDDSISCDPDIVGLSISTRPDCVNEEIIKLISSYKDKLPYVSIEYGMQTMHDKTLATLNRGETHLDFIKAVELTKKYNIDQCAHVILGLPGESWNDQMETAKTIARLGVNGVKIHILVAMEGTPIADDYKKGLWQPLEYQEQVTLACDFMEQLRPDCIIHRIGGNGHADNIVAPKWIIKNRVQILRDVVKEFAIRNSYQGKRYISNQEISSLSNNNHTHT